MFQTVCLLALVLIAFTLAVVFAMMIKVFLKGSPSLTCAGAVRLHVLSWTQSGGGWRSLRDKALWGSSDLCQFFSW